MKTLSRAELRAARVERRPEDHKGVFGHALVVAGSRGMAGAAILCARAALRSGAGLVTVAVPAGLQPLVAAAAPEALTLGLPENSSGALRPEGLAKLKAAHKERGFATLALGPGLSTHADAARFVLHALSAFPLPAVVDADAINVLAQQEPRGVAQLMRGRRHPCVFTPHPGEIARCLGMTPSDVQKDRQGCAERLARDWHGIVLLKGGQTVVSDGRRSVVNATGGPGLAKGGSGDVLTGLLAGLWAQAIVSGRAENDPLAIAALAAHLHGAAGDAAELEKTAWALTALDVVDALPAAFRSL